MLLLGQPCDANDALSHSDQYTYEHTSSTNQHIHEYGDEHDNQHCDRDSHEYADDDRFSEGTRHIDTDPNGYINQYTNSDAYLN